MPQNAPPPSHSANSWQGLVGHDDSRVDIAVVGSGPCGLYAARELSRSFPGFRIVVIESGPVVSAAVDRYPDVRWHSSMASLKLGSPIDVAVPDHYAPTSHELAKYLQSFAKQAGLHVVTDTALTNMEKSVADEEKGWILSLTTPSGESGAVFAPIVVLATGIYGNPRPFEPPGQTDRIHRYLDIGVKGENIVLVGGGTSAADAITHLLPHNRISWVVRDEKPHKVWIGVRPSFEAVMAQYGDNLKLFTQTEVAEIQSSTVLLSSGESISDVDQVLGLIGFEPASPLFEKIGIEMFRGGIVLSERFETTLPGVFAFGSVANGWDDAAGKVAASFVENGHRQRFPSLRDGICARLVTGMYGELTSSQPWVSDDRSNSQPEEKIVRPGRIRLFIYRLWRMLSHR